MPIDSLAGKDSNICFCFHKLRQLDWLALPCLHSPLKRGASLSPFPAAVLLFTGAWCPVSHMGVKGADSRRCQLCGTLAAWAASWLGYKARLSGSGV